MIDIYDIRQVFSEMNEETKRLVLSQPEIDAAPVVHGHWVEKELFIPWCDDDVDIIYECSCCRTESGGTSPYCPNCGAKMDGGAPCEY